MYNKASERKREREGDKKTPREERRGGGGRRRRRRRLGIHSGESRLQSASDCTHHGVLYVCMPRVTNYSIIDVRSSLYGSLSPFLAGEPVPAPSLNEGLSFSQPPVIGRRSHYIAIYPSVPPNCWVRLSPIRSKGREEMLCDRYREVWSASSTP